MSYQDYLLNVAKVDKQCLWFFMTTGRGNFCVGADAIAGALRVGHGRPGFAASSSSRRPTACSPICRAAITAGRRRGGGGSIHFPDGNATIARLLVRWLIPDAVPGHDAGRRQAPRASTTRCSIAPASPRASA